MEKLNILVIGGSYFLGKAFTEAALKNGHRLVLLNRGTKEVSTQGIEHIKADRHNLSEADFSDYSFDAIVDFCGYEKNDIRDLIKAVKPSSPEIKRYIFISTVDVYKRGSNKVIDENAVFENRDFGGAVGQYILGKVALEEELAEISREYGLLVNSIRPGLIYGPGNYSGREDMFVNWAKAAGQVLFPKDSDGHFRMVYVGDVAKAILHILEEDLSDNRNYNIIGDEVVNYQSFIQALSYALNLQIEKVEISIDEINERGIPFPYPLTKEESENYTSLYRDNLPFNYISLKEGLKNTFN